QAQLLLPTGFLLLRQQLNHFFTEIDALSRLLLDEISQLKSGDRGCPSVEIAPRLILGELVPQGDGRLLKQVLRIGNIPNTAINQPKELLLVATEQLHVRIIPRVSVVTTANF